MCVFGSLRVHGQVAKERILSLASLDSVRLSKGSLCEGCMWQVLVLKIDKEMCYVNLCADKGLEMGVGGKRMRTLVS